MFIATRTKQAFKLLGGQRTCRSYGALWCFSALAINVSPVWGLFFPAGKINAEYY
jgi:hypothetical protein